MSLAEEMRYLTAEMQVRGEAGDGPQTVLECWLHGARVDRRRRLVGDAHRLLGICWVAG